MQEKDISNAVRLSSAPREAATSVQTVAWLTSYPTVAASGHTSFWLTYVDPVTLKGPTPVTSAVTPVTSTDYRITAQADGLGGDYTSTASVAVTFFATTAVCSVFNGTGSPAFVSKFNLRGVPLLERPKIDIESEDGSSQAVYGTRQYTLASNLITNRLYAENYIEYLLLTKKKFCL